MTVAELQARISVAELREWQEFYRYEPFLPERVDIMGALLASMQANSNRPKGKSPYGLSEFLIVEKMLQESTLPSVDQEAAYMQSVIIGLGGKVA